MAVKLRNLGLCLGLAACAGCGAASHVRLPTLWPSSPAAERQAYNVHDPLPDPDFGRQTESIRPRDADIPRPEPVRIRSATLGPWNSFVAPPPGPPPAAFNYPNVVAP